MTLEPEPDWKGPRVFMDLAISDRPLGRIVIELYADKCPRTCENFRQLCTGQYRPNEFPVGYKDTPIHRIIPGFIMQGGDCEKKDGTGILSIYGFTFDDEPSNIEFDEAGIVAMANSGPNTNGCQFFITLDEATDLNGQYVAFGKVIEGLYTLRQVEAVPLRPGTDQPSLYVHISQCGEF